MWVRNRVTMWGSPEAETMRSPRAFRTLVGRYDRAAFEPDDGRARVRLVVAGRGAWDAVLERGGASLTRADGDADALLTAGARTWEAIAQGVPGVVPAVQSGRLTVRRNLHLGVGFLAATSGVTGPGRLLLRSVVTRRARLSTIEAGVGRPVLAIHGLGVLRDRSCPRSPHCLIAFGSLPSIFRVSATPTSRSERRMTRASSPRRWSTFSTHSNSTAWS